MPPSILTEYLSAAETMPPQTARMIAGGTQVFSPQEVDRAVDRLSVGLTVEFQDQNPVLLTVLHGGVVLAGMLLRRLVFPCEFGYLHATRYGDATHGKRLEWRGEDTPDLKNRVVLLVDDILDEGTTMTALVQHCREAGASAVHPVVLVERTGVERSEQITHAALQTGAGFLIGSGMDVAGYGRNLPGVYKLDV